jgi:hypothetical protein
LQLGLSLVQPVLGSSHFIETPGQRDRLNGRLLEGNLPLQVFAIGRTRESVSAPTQHLTPQS